MKTEIDEWYETVAGNDKCIRFKNEIHDNLGPYCTVIEFLPPWIILEERRDL